MNLPSFSVSWVDFVTAIVLLIGFIRGRKRGFSEELLDTVQWLVIVFTCGFFYRQLSDLMHLKLLSQLANYVLSYVLIAIILKIFFSTIKRAIGQKIVDGDVFGRGEFYLGMAAGMVRWTCMYFFLLSLLHAPHYSQEYRTKKAKEDDYNYGDIRLPSVMGMQDEVYKRSFTGTYSEKYLAMMLIAPATADSQQLRSDNSLGRRREREVDAIMGR